MHFRLPTNTTLLSPLHSAIKPLQTISSFSYKFGFQLSPNPFFGCRCLLNLRERSDLGVFDDMPVRKSINHIPPSPVKINLEEESLMKQGILTILSSDCDTTKPVSIRRTLSADLSSKKWLHQNGFLSPIKKTVSSEALAHPTDSSSEIAEDECEHVPNQDDVWRSIQAQKQRNQPSENQVWGSILTQKSESSTLPPPYVHPLVKRSAASLTDKSLEICTEIFGSETGSDCFSCSEIQSDVEEDKDGERVDAEEFKDSNPFPHLHVAKYRKSPARPFPPPLPSISGGDGASLHMQSHRENGRLVVEAVSVPPRNHFQALRQDGRLLLTMIHAPATSDEEIEKVFDDMEEVDEESQLPEEVVVEERGLSLHSGMIKVDKSGLVMKKVAGNINPTWSKKMDDEELPIPQSLPPRVARFMPSTAPPAAASFNVYEYFWRNKTAGFLNPMITNKMNGTKGYENQDLVLMRANKTEQFGPYLKGCKEARKSLAIPEPSCWIATS